jgi:hypothetical protein
VTAVRDSLVLPSVALVAVLQVICQLAPMLSKHLLSVTPVLAQVGGAPADAHIARVLIPAYDSCLLGAAAWWPPNCNCGTRLQVQQQLCQHHATAETHKHHVECVFCLLCTSLCCVPLAGVGACQLCAAAQP